MVEFGRKSKVLSESWLIRGVLLTMDDRRNIYIDALVEFSLMVGIYISVNCFDRIVLDILRLVLHSDGAGQAPWRFRYIALAVDDTEYYGLMLFTLWYLTIYMYESEKLRWRPSQIP